MNSRHGADRNKRGRQPYHWKRAARAACLLLQLSLPLAVVRAQSYDFTEVTDLLDGNLDLYGSNVLVVVRQDDREIYRYQFGSITGDTRIPVASATKWLSGAIILKLAEQGYLDLDDRVGDYLPLFDEQAKGDITIRQCFAMSSGLVEATADYEQDPSLTLAQSVMLIASNTPVVFPPGTQLGYDGDGMQTVGRIAEVVTGKDWRALASELLFSPLGMTNCDYYTFVLNPCISGGARCTPDAYLRFLDMIAKNGACPDGGVLLASSSVQEFFENQTDGLSEYYSPWPESLTYPYGERPDYSIGAWVLAQDQVTHVVEEVCGPGAFGTFPWVDRTRRIRGAIFMLGLGGFARTAGNDLRILAAIRDEIDRVGLPPLGDPGTLSLDLIDGYLRVSWTGSGTIESTVDLTADVWTNLSWATSPYHVLLGSAMADRGFFRAVVERGP